MKQNPSPTASISIVIPTLNEAANLPALFKRIDDSFKHTKIGYEVVLVDDRSSDGTARLAKRLASKYPIRVLIKKGQRGKAFSLLQGFAAARYNILCMIDADLQYPPEAIVPMYQNLIDSNADVVITERYSHETSFMRQLSSKVFNLVFTKMMFGIDYDTQSGLKLFKKQVIANMNLTPSPWSFDLEFIIRSLESDFKVMNQRIPFSARTAGQPKVHIVSVAYELALATIKLRRNTAMKRVRLNYQQNAQVFSRTLTVLIGLVIGVIASAGIGQHHVEALAINSSSVKSLTSSVTSVAKATNSIVKNVDKTLDINNPIVTVPVSTPTPTTSSQTSASTQAGSPASAAPTTTGPVSTQTQTASTTAASSPSTTTASTTSALVSSSTTARASKALSSSVGQLASPSAALSKTTSPNLLGISSANSAKPKDYYNTGFQLTATDTHDLTTLSYRMAIIGGILCIAGSIVWVLYIIFEKLRQHFDKQKQITA